MKMFKSFSLLVFISLISSCSSDDDASSSTSYSDVIVESLENIVLDTSLFSEYSRVGDSELVDCTLSNGSETKCYKTVYEKTNPSLDCLENDL